MPKGKNTLAVERWQRQVEERFRAQCKADEEYLRELDRAKARACAAVDDYFAGKAPKGSWSF